MPDIRHENMVSEAITKPASNKIEESRQRYLNLIRTRRARMPSRDIRTTDITDFRGYHILHERRTVFADDAVYRDENPPGAIAIRNISGVPIRRAVTTNLAWRDGEALRNIRVLLDNFNVVTIGTINVEEGNTLVLSPVHTLDFNAADFDVVADGANEVDIRRSQNIETVTGALTLDDTHRTVLADATSAAFTITLPPAADVTKRIYTIKRINAGGNKVTVDADGAETIDKAATQVIGKQFDAMKIQSDGTEWWII